MYHHINTIEKLVKLALQLSFGGTTTKTWSRIKLHVILSNIAGYARVRSSEVA